MILMYNILFQDIIMGRGKDITDEERQLITQKLGQGKPAHQIAKELKWDTRIF